MANKDKTIPLLSRSEKNELIVWDTSSVANTLYSNNSEASLKSAERVISSTHFPESLEITKVVDEHDRKAKQVVLKHVVEQAQKKRQLILIMQYHQIDDNHWVLYTNDRRMGRRWVINKTANLTSDFLK